MFQSQVDFHGYKLQGDAIVEIKRREENINSVRRCIS
jgi:hypothetical protein